MNNLKFGCPPFAPGAQEFAPGQQRITVHGPKSVILSGAKNLSVTVDAAQSTIACEAFPVNNYHVYIVASASRVLHIGVSGDLLRRIMQYKQMRIPGFTARYRAIELVYFEAFGEIRVAIVREKQLKGWLRAKKIALIESFNPHWRDLTADLQSPTPHRKPQRDSSLRSE